MKKQKNEAKPKKQILKKIVALWIDFDDYKAFDGVLMILAWKKIYCISGVKLYFYQVLIWKPQEQEQKICNLLEKILYFLDIYFEKK